MLWNGLTVRCCRENKQNIVVTTGNNNYTSTGIVQEVYRKNINSNLILQIHNAEIMLDRRNYFWKLLHKNSGLMEFNSARIVIPYLRYETIGGLMFSALTIQEFLTTPRLLDVHKGFVKY